MKYLLFFKIHVKTLNLAYIILETEFYANVWIVFVKNENMLLNEIVNKAESFTYI